VRDARIAEPQEGLWRKALGSVTIQEWIQNHRWDEWGVLTIHESRRFTLFGTNGEPMIGIFLEDKIEGIHVKNLLVIADKFPEPFETSIQSLSSCAGYRRIPWHQSN
jgi:hypothetical protein